MSLSAVAVAHGALTVTVSEAAQVSQPGAFSRGGDTAQVDRTDIEIKEAGGDLRVLPASTTVGDVAAALNALGAKPRDLVSIFQALKAAGALRAELEVL